MTFPTGVAFDAAGRVYIVDAGDSYGEVFHAPKLLRVDAQGQLATIATGEENARGGVCSRTGSSMSPRAGRAATVVC